jgi:hypothetical protein
MQFEKALTELTKKMCSPSNILSTVGTYHVASAKVNLLEGHRVKGRYNSEKTNAWIAARHVIN